MAFRLNTRSFTLHNDDHGGEDNTEEFDRADAADLFALNAGKRMTFCKQCFPGNRNSVQDQALADAEAALRSPEGPGSGPTESSTPRGTEDSTVFRRGRVTE